MVVEPADLLGDWQLRRSIADARASQSGSVAGQLTLRTDSDQITWSEQGTLAWSGRLIPVVRSYRFQRTEGQWWLHFADGRPFHPWLPGEWVSHPCGEDTYTGLVTVTSSAERLTEWRTEWHIEGPDKSLRITTWLSHI